MLHIHFHDEVHMPRCALSLAGLFEPDDKVEGRLCFLARIHPYFDVVRRGENDVIPLAASGTQNAIGAYQVVVDRLQEAPESSHAVTS